MCLFEVPLHDNHAARHLLLLRPMAPLSGLAEQVPIGVVQPNSWNPNVMDDVMFQKELRSITRFGFVDPIIVREIEGSHFEVIDGEHRLKAATQLGFEEVPIWNLGEVEDDTARELTIVLNETRGSSDRERLSALLKDLVSRRDERELRDVMPFSRERFNELLERKEIDWSALEEKRAALKEQGERRWVERVYRLPLAAAEVVDDAISRAMEQGEFTDEWQALEAIAADYLSGS